jgi:hypothetical protein
MVNYLPVRWSLGFRLPQVGRSHSGGLMMIRVEWILVEINLVYFDLLGLNLISGIWMEVILHWFLNLAISSSLIW